MYCPVHRYARDIIVGFNHGVSGWIDWNIVLDAQGGPNHVGNFCGAPIMIDRQTGQIHYTPVFSVLSQLSRTIRPGDRALACTAHAPDLEQDTLHACATVDEGGKVSVQFLNTSEQALEVDLCVGGQVLACLLPANALQTVQFDTASSDA